MTAISAKKRAAAKRLAAAKRKKTQLSKAAQDGRKRGGTKAIVAAAIAAGAYVPPKYVAKSDEKQARGAFICTYTDVYDYVAKNNGSTVGSIRGAFSQRPNMVNRVLGGMWKRAIWSVGGKTGDGENLPAGTKNRTAKLVALGEALNAQSVVKIVGERHSRSVRKA